MLKLKQTVLLLITTFIVFIATAQEVQTTADNAGFMRSNGKIYVVVAIVLTILAGLVLYVARLDRKISKIEKKENL